ncbi:MAG: hypothetical protein HC822_14600 [Oscillochloris sp.]|nr:hypothetical protein [Oscillochloris sp.]
MQRLTATLQHDIRIQARNGFYAAAAFVAVSWTLLLGVLPQADLRAVMPALLLGNLLVGSFYFVGGMTLLERAEGSLAARGVTPLRPGEYLAARAISLGGLALVEHIILTLIFVGLRFQLLPLLLGIGLGGLIFTWAGLAFVARYNSINAYLMPSVALSAFLTLPAVGQLFGWPNRLLLWHPLQPAITLLQGAFQPLSAWEWLYALVAGIGWASLSFRWARAAYLRLVQG